MKVSFQVPTKLGENIDALGVCLFEKAALAGDAAKLDERLGGLISACLKEGDFKGHKLELRTLLVHRKGLPKRVVLIGLGEQKEFHLQTLEQAAGALVRSFLEPKRQAVAMLLPVVEGKEPAELVEAATEGAVLGGYVFNLFLSKDNRKAAAPEQFVLGSSALRAPKAEAAIERGLAIAEAMNLAREVADLPANASAPETLAKLMAKILGTARIKTQILHAAELKRLGMGALLAVGQGSHNPPCLMIAEYKGNGPTVMLVGKGLVFDSGGICIKPSKGMEEMKFDMCGAAAVMGTLLAAARLELPYHIVGLMPMAENMPGGGAVKPGDIVRTYSGRTVEVTNTDAEGRLVLADALSYGEKKFKPQLAVDLATLTGSCVVALGTEISGLFARQQVWAQEFKAAGDRSGDWVWELPLWKPYFESMKSSSADFMNVAASRWAGAIEGGLFLDLFVSKDKAWVHLDIAGTAYDTGKKSYRSSGATGAGIKLLIDLLEHTDKLK